MNILKMAQNSPQGNKSLYQVISDLGLTTNLKLCLDAGDSASYSPSLQTDKWLDTSGGGFDFFRGSGTGSDTADPTFNGAAGGLSSNEYWSFDGGDRFTYDTTNETWMENLHKNNAIYTVFCVQYIVSLTTSHFILGTRGSTGTGVTFNTLRGTTSSPLVFVANGGSTVLIADSTLDCNNNAWNVVGISVNEGTASGVFLLNGSTETFNSTYSSPSTGNAATTMCLGSTGGGASNSPNGSRIACLAVWEGTQLTTTNLTNIYNAIKGRFGL